jgi:hypothetical protein
MYKVLIFQKASQLQQELNMLDAEKQSKDLNYIRAAERMNKTKAVFDDNMKMQDLNQLYADRNRINNNDLIRDGQYGKTGDIFDSMFERQQHWRNVK